MICMTCNYINIPMLPIKTVLNTAIANKLGDGIHKMKLNLYH